MEDTLDVTDGHITNMGRMIEEMESKLRNGLDQVGHIEIIAISFW